MVHDLSNLIVWIFRVPLCEIYQLYANIECVIPVSFLVKKKVFMECQSHYGIKVTQLWWLGSQWNFWEVLSNLVPRGVIEWEIWCFTVTTSQCKVREPNVKTWPHFVHCEFEHEIWLHSKWQDVKIPCLVFEVRGWESWTVLFLELKLKP